MSKWVSSLLEHWIDVKMVMGLNSFLVFEEAMVLRRWESDTWKFGLVKQVDINQAG